MTKKKFHYYIVFGLEIKSNIRFQEMMPGGQGKDILIQYNQLPDVLEPCLFQTSNYQVNQSEVLLKEDNLSLFLIKNGNQININPKNDMSFTELKLRLFGSAMATILQQKQFIVLHGCVIAHNQKAIFILGDKGAGKSTLAAQMHNIGYDILSDDKCVINRQNNQFLALPSYPNIKLCEDSSQLFFTDLASKEVLTNEINKFILDIRIDFTNQATQVVAGFVFRSNVLNHKYLTKPEALSRIWHHSYKRKKIKGMNLENNYFKKCAELINYIPIYDIPIIHNKLEIKPNNSSLMSLIDSFFNH